ncbi:MAG: DNA polymerase III subunit gamma/tau [Candidatus Taylorbacteria bacterium]|nr:DNA polymerase III subunit gamma/tau [Candidatus Taylorbacteria bacterium]
MTVLYRTYRPQKWPEVMGQDHIIEGLKDAIANGRISHAYLFSGSRGTGKTTVARIFAREIKTAGDDTYEIDAASNRGIDDIRQLREHVSVLPFSSPFKVYIIDEVHMLSKDAWNALLKTLEEPPKHVIFILATTELDKVPETIVSRCQTFVFRKPSREIIRKQVTLVAKKEDYEVDAGAADLIALLGDGSFRDALGTLEKVIAASADKKITREEVEAITGAPRAGLVNQFIESLIDKKEDVALKAITEAEKGGVSMTTFTTLILEKMRFILLVQHSKSSEASVRDRVSPDDWEFIAAQAGKNSLTPSTLVVLLEAADGVGRARIAELPLELAVVKICGIV